MLRKVTSLVPCQHGSHSTPCLAAHWLQRPLSPLGPLCPPPPPASRPRSLGRQLALLGLLAPPRSVQCLSVFFFVLCTIGLPGTLLFLDTLWELGVTRIHLVQRITQALWKCFSKLESPRAFSEKWMYRYPVYQQVYLGLKTSLKVVFLWKSKNWALWLEPLNLFMHRKP